MSSFYMFHSKFILFEMQCKSFIVAGDKSIHARLDIYIFLVRIVNEVYIIHSNTVIELG